MYYSQINYHRDQGNVVFSNLISLVFRIGFCKIYSDNRSYSHTRLAVKYSFLYRGYEAYFSGIIPSHDFSVKACDVAEKLKIIRGRLRSYSSTRQIIEYSSNTNVIMDLAPDYHECSQNLFKSL